MRRQQVHSIQSPARQQGAVLLLGLLLLLTLTILGVASFQNANVQERAASNARMQSMAFEAAAAGANNAPTFFFLNKASTPDDQCGSLDHEGWVDAEGNATPTAWQETTYGVGGVTLSQRMYCLADAYPCEDPGNCTVERPPSSQLFVQTRGELKSGDTVIASRDVEVRLGVLGGLSAPGGDGCGALCFPGCEYDMEDFEIPNSNALQVIGHNNGDGGPAVTAGNDNPDVSECTSFIGDFQDEVKPQRIANYLGGFSMAGESIWQDPVAITEFTDNLRELAKAAELAGTCQVHCYIDTVPDVGCEGECFNTPDYGSIGSDENGPYYELSGRGNTHHILGDPNDPQITFIDGDLHMGGNVNGDGILYVVGDIYWNGTNEFSGLIVTLGGTLHVDGGGRADNLGSVIMVGYDPASDTFNDVAYQQNGGGTATYQYDCDALQMAHDLLDTDTAELWSPDCDDTGGGTPWEANLTDIRVMSWRENIGWREAYFNEGGE